MFAAFTTPKPPPALKARKAISYPLDAALKSIERMTSVHATLTDFALQSITSGKDAQAEVTVTVRFEDKTLLTGKASSTDIVEAGAKAYLNCINRYLAR